MTLATNEHPWENRKISEAHLAMILEDAVLLVLGKKLTKASLCVLLAHSAHEQGAAPNGDRIHPGSNGYGIKSIPGQDFFTSATKEGHHATEVTTRAKFRWWPTAEAAALSYVRLLATAPRYKGAWAAVEATDLEAFVEGLREHPGVVPPIGGYFSGDPSEYITSMRRNWTYCALRTLNYPITPDGVKRFEQDHALTVDTGLIGPQVRGALKIALGG